MAGKEKDLLPPVAATPGAVLLMRHATAPGTGDPPDLRLGDCTTQRNLSEEGRKQAARQSTASSYRHISSPVMPTPRAASRDTASSLLAAAREVTQSTTSSTP